MDKTAQHNLKLLAILEFLSKFSLFQGVIIVYFASVTHSFALAMTALAIIHISASLFEVPTGIFSDHIGRKATIILYQAAWLLTIIIYFLSDSFALLVIGAIVQGLGYSLRSGTTSAFVYENSEVLNDQKEFMKQEGHRRSAGFFSEVCSGLLGATVIFFFDIRTAVFVTIFFVGTAFILSFRLVNLRIANPETSNIYAHFGEAWRNMMKDASLRNLSIARMIAAGAGNVEYRYRSLLFASIMPEWLVSLIVAAGDLCTGIVMKYAHVFVRRLGYVTNLVYIEVLGPVISVALTLMKSIPAFFAMDIITSIIFGFREIAAENLLQERYKKEKRATMGSIVGLGGSIIYGTLGIVMGILADSIGLVYTMVAMQVIIALPAFFFYRGIVIHK